MSTSRLSRELTAAIFQREQSSMRVSQLKCKNLHAFHNMSTYNLSKLSTRSAFPPSKITMANRRSCQISLTTCVQLNFSNVKQPIKAACYGFHTLFRSLSRHFRGTRVNVISFLTTVRLFFWNPSPSAFY